MPPGPLLVLVVNFAATWFLVGLIWLVQVVQYPLFAAVGRDAFGAYHAGHARLITLVVAPAMGVELLTSAALLVYRPAAVPAWVAWVGAGAAVGLWLSTAFLQVPLHNALSAGFDPAAARSLVAGNWLRTALWTARGLLVGYAVVLAATAGRN